MGFRGDVRGTRSEGCDDMAVLGGRGRNHDCDVASVALVVGRHTKPVRAVAGDARVGRGRPGQATERELWSSVNCDRAWTVIERGQ